MGVIKADKGAIKASVTAGNKGAAKVISKQLKREKEELKHVESKRQSYSSSSKKERQEKIIKKAIGINKRVAKGKSTGPSAATVEKDARAAAAKLKAKIEAVKDAAHPKRAVKNLRKHLYGAVNKLVKEGNNRARSKHLHNVYQKVQQEKKKIIRHMEGKKAVKPKKGEKKKLEKELAGLKKRVNALEDAKNKHDARKAKARLADKLKEEKLMPAYATGASKHSKPSEADYNKALKGDIPAAMRYANQVRRRRSKKHEKNKKK